MSNAQRRRVPGPLGSAERPVLPPLAGAAVLSCALALCAPPARAQLGPAGPPPRHRLLYRSLTGAQFNPLGVQTDFFLDYRYRLYRSEALALQDNYAGPMAIVRVNPAFSRLGGGLALQPLTVLTLSAMAEARLYYGTFNMLQSFPDPLQEYDEQTLKARGKAGESYVTAGLQLTLQAVLRAKVGPVALLDDLNLIYFSMDLAPGDRVFYVNLLDSLAEDRGWTLVNNANLLYLTRFGLAAGARHTLVHNLYSAELLRGSGGQNPNSPHHRVGPMVAYAFASSRRWLQQPMAVLIVNWWIGNRYRSGQRVAQGVPYLALAFTAQGDLWTR